MKREVSQAKVRDLCSGIFWIVGFPSQEDLREYNEAIGWIFVLQKKFANHSIGDVLSRSVLNRSVEEIFQIRLSIENGGLCHDMIT